MGWLQSLGHGLAAGHELSPDHPGSERTGTGETLLPDRLRSALGRLNPALPRDTLDEVIRVVSHPPHPTLPQNNRWFHRLFTDGVPVEYRDARTGETRGGRARLVAFDDPTANDLLVVRQLVVTGPSGKLIRPDLTVFLNGLPVAVIELKDPADPRADLWTAVDQLDRYMGIAPELFVPNLVLVASDGMLTRVGSITSPRSRFMPWRPLHDDADDGGAPTLEALIRGLFDPHALVDYLRSCVVFEEDERGEIRKKIAGYHQFRALRKARASVLESLKPPIGEGDGRGGVIWHTQGSGKSLTMLMLAGALIREPRMANPTVVMITDRNDLDDQLFDTFAAGRALLRQDPVQAESREHLQALLDRAAGGVVFTTIQKFAEEHAVVSERANLVVMADEAHRSQYGFVEGGARWMREALPNATFVGFTGTPLERGRQEHDPRLRRVCRRLRHPPGGRGRRHPAALLRVAHRQAAGRRGGRARRRAAARVRRQRRRERGSRGRSDQHRAEAAGRCARAHRAAGRVHRQALGEAPRGDGGQGDGRYHEPRHRRTALRGDPRAAPGVARPGRRARRGESGGHRHRRRRRTAAQPRAHQGGAQAPGGALQRPCRRAAPGDRGGHVADGLRLPAGAYHVPGQAAGGPQLDAGHRAGEPRLRRQARRADRGPARPRRPAGRRARDL